MYKAKVKFKMMLKTLQIPIRIIRTFAFRNFRTSPLRGEAFAVRSQFPIQSLSHH
jgi:hypothetical protein